MTALNAAILFNNSTGSDTTSSGSSAGANVYGSGASTTSASAVVAGITTTGVQAGDLLWVQSSSGRQFSVIASVDSGTQVTCDDTFANTESSRTWAIGGKRATFDNADSRLLFSDTIDATIETETDQTINSIVFVELGNLVKGSDGSQTITGTHNDAHFWGNGFVLADMTFATTNSTNTATAAYKNSGSNRTFHAVNLTVDGMTFGAISAGSTIGHNWLRCKVTNLSNYVISRSSGSMAVSISRCYVDTASGAVNYSGGTQRGCEITNSFFANCTGDVLSGSRTSPNTEILGNVFVNNAGNCVNFDFDNQRTTIANNIFSANTGYAINSTVDPSVVPDIYSNAYYSNTAGNTSTGSVESSAITLTADPFVDAAGGDFNLNADSSGATLRANNFSLNTDTAVYPFRQYVSDDFDSGGGGGNVIVIED